MNRAILCLLVAACAVLSVGAEWQKRDSGTLAWLLTVQFLDANTGFAAGSNGTLLTTTDGGVRWKKAAVPGKDTIRDVHFLDTLNGWMLCDRGKFRSGRNASYLLRTADGARTWSALELPEGAERFSRLFFEANGTGYLVGEGGTMLALSGRSGATSRYTLPLRFLIADGVSPEPGRLVLGGGGGSLIVSEDGGLNWQSARFAERAPEAMLNSVFFLDRQTGWTVGNTGSILFTVDGGRWWGPQASGVVADLVAVAFSDRQNGFAVGAGGTILRTSNAGASWTPDVTGTKHRLERLAFAGRRAVAVGFGGTIISTDLP